MAAFLDPRFKLHWVRNAEEEAEMVSMATAENMIAEEGVTVAPEPATLDPTPRQIQQKMTYPHLDKLSAQYLCIPAS